MPQSRPPFITGEIYHIYNRGVEKRKVFLDDQDYYRMIHNLFEFNDQSPALNLTYHIKHQSLEVGLPKIVRKPRKLLVDLMAFCLMPNHYHFLVRQRVEGGITLFMRKLGTGYTNYFNEKNERVGPLFQGKFKAVVVTNERHLLYLPHYIHLNPLDVSFPEWRDQNVTNVRNAMQYIDNYRWSSYRDYIGKKNFPSITHRDFIHDLLGDHQSYRKEITQWLKSNSVSALSGYTYD